MKTHALLVGCALILAMVPAAAIARAAQQAGPLAGPAPADSGPAGNAPQAPTAQDTAASSAAKDLKTPPQNAAAHGATIQVPSGTRIPLVLHNGISTKSARPGDPVYFETLFPIMEEGRVVIPAGTYISGEVTESKRAGRVKGRAELMIKLTTMILPNAYMVDLNAVPGSGGGTGGGETVDKEGRVSGDTDKASDAGTIARTAAAGAGIGAIAARTGEGAGIGAGIGAAAGLAAVLLSRGPDAELPRGSTLEAVTERALYLEADKVQFTSPGQSSTLAGPPSREPVRNKVPF